MKDDNETLLKEYDEAMQMVYRLELSLTRAKAVAEQYRRRLGEALQPNLAKKGSKRISSTTTRVLSSWEIPRSVREILEVVGDDFPVNIEKVAKLLNCSLEVARLRLQRAHNKGFLQRIQHGWYDLPEEKKVKMEELEEETRTLEDSEESTKS